MVKAKRKSSLLVCFGGGDGADAVVDDDQRAREQAEIAAMVDESLAKMACTMADLRRTVEDMERAWAELEQLIPELFLHQSRWQRVKDAFRRPSAKVAPTNLGDDGPARVAMMNPFLRKFLSTDA